MIARGEEKESPDPPMKSPSERLAELIAKKLVAENLVSEDECKKLLPKITAAKMRAEDWRLAIEKGTDAVTKP